MAYKYVSLFLLTGITFIHVCLGQSTPSYVPKTGLVGWWSFDGNANDASGNANHGVIQGYVTLTTDRQNSQNKAYNFNGSTDSYINVPFSSSLNIKNALTVSAWVLMNGGYYNPRLLSIYNGRCESFFIAAEGTSNSSRNFNSHFINSDCQTGSGFCCNIPGMTVPALTWQHVIYTVDTFGVSRFYLNGELKNTKTGVKVSNPSYASSLNIGRNAVPAYDAWGGKIDDIGIWNRSLNQQEILQLYNSSSVEISGLNWTRVDSGNCLKVIPNLDSSLLFLSRVTDVLKSNDKGTNWTPTNWPFPIVRDGYSISKGGAYSSFGGGMLNVARFDNGWGLSTNNGNSYVTSGPEGFGTGSISVIALKDGRFLASRGGFLRGIYKSSGTNNATWSDKYSGFDAYDFSKYDEDTIFCSGFNNGGNKAILLKSVNRGETWTAVDVPGTFISDVEVIGDSLYFVDNRGIFRVSSITNYGSSTIKYNFNFTQDAFNHCTYYSDLNLLVLSSSIFGVYVSKNRGVDWTKYTFTGVTNYRDATIVKDRIYIATDKGLYVTQISPSTSGCSIDNFNPFPSTTTYSKADSLKLDGGSGYTTYTWSTGATTQSTHVKYTGGYRVTVTNASGCTASDSVFIQFPDTAGLHVSTVSAVCNKSVDIPIRVTAYRNVISMQGSINWNAADLRFDSIASYGSTALGLSFANFSTAKISNGQLTFSWNDPAGTGQTLADSTVLITLRFTALGTTIRSVPVTVTGNPTPLEFYDAALVKKSSVQTAGAVDISCEFTISGKVLTPTDKGVKNVTMTLTGGPSPLTALTDSAGNYSFKILPGTYTITPSKIYEQFKTNGISTIDLVFIQAHILQRTPFTSAYKMFASDANNSSSVTTADILSIRRLILGADTTLPDNRLWAFVDGGQNFANPTAPFPFSSTKTFTNQSTDVSHTFRGIKIGDVNYDRNPLLDQAPSGDTLRLFGEWIDTEDGYVTLKVKSRAVSGLLGWQSTLRWDAKQLQLQNTTGLINNLGIGERWKDDGYLTLSWNDPRAEGLSFTEGSTWMELRFRKTSALQQAGIGMTEEKLGTEAFNGNYQSMGVKMESVELRGNAWNGMLRVYPNPATQYMNVEWKMVRAGKATVRLLDAQGRVVHVQRGEYGAGVQRVTIKRSGAWSVAGTWMVQVDVDGEVRNVPVVLGGEEPRP